MSASDYKERKKTFLYATIYTLIMFFIIFIQYDKPFISYSPMILSLLAGIISLVAYEFRSLNIINKHLAPCEYVVYRVRLSRIYAFISPFIIVGLPLLILVAFLGYKTVYGPISVSKHSAWLYASLYVYIVPFVLVPSWKMQMVYTNKRILVENGRQAVSIPYNSMKSTSEVKGATGNSIIIKYDEKNTKAFHERAFSNYEEMKKNLFKIMDQFKNCKEV